jgi:pirin-like protein
VPGRRTLFIGGEPFDEQLVMWWNFVGRDHDEIVEAREEWMSGQRLGTVRGYAGDPLPAPSHTTGSNRAAGIGRHRLSDRRRAITTSTLQAPGNYDRLVHLHRRATPGSSNAIVHCGQSDPECASKIP